MNRPPDYRLIYNWDGAPHGYSPVPQSLEEFLEAVYAPLIDTQVDALFWCVGEHAARWPSGSLEVVGDLFGRRYESASTWIHTENIRRMLERGEDPQAAVIERGRELGIAVYASLRMNDNHFNGAGLSDLAALHHGELTQLRREHPEWLLGERTSEWFALSWDLSVPEVRRHRLDHVRELCERYDWDGIELDWQRHGFHLPADEAYRLRYTITDLQRAARQVTDRTGEQRGRPLCLAARVATSLEACADIGYDVETWLQEDLVDLLIGGGGAATDPAVEVERFQELCRPRGVPFYPGFDSGLPDPWVGPESADRKNRLRTRAIAARHHRAGADGIYLFNWHSGAKGPRPEMMREIGDPAILEQQDKVYAATHRHLVCEGPWRGAYRNDRRRGQVPVPLVPTLTGRGPVVDVETAESGTPLAAELRLHLKEWVEGDEVAVRWNGEELEDPEVSYNLPGSDADQHSFAVPVSQVSSDVWLRYPLAPDILGSGLHRVEAILRKRHPQLASDLILTDVEIAVAWSQQYAAALLPRPG